MARGKILAICQSGGEFITNSDGSMSYSGGEAHAIDINCEMSLSDLRSEISAMFNFNADTFSIKYFLPRNKRTLITISNDKDLQRMVDFHADSDTTDIFVTKKVESRIIRSVVADSGTSTDANTASVATLEEAKRQKLCINWDSMITGVGQVFSSPKAFRDALHKYAIANSFMYRFIKNDGSRVTAECTVEDCPWRIHASRSSAKQKFMIKKMNDIHTCGKELSKESRRLASQRWVASIIKDKLRDTPNYRPKDIAKDLQQEYGLSLNYSQAWRGKFIAKKELHNSHEEAFSQLSWFCERIIETNPGSVATLHTSDDSKFCFFVTFHASLYGFEHGCRPLLFLDGLSLKANKQWKLLAATAVDGQNDIYPVAFCVLDSEASENWHWFLVQLKSAFTLSRAITFVSSSQNGLEELPEVFEDSFHGYSEQQLIENFKKEMDESWTQELKNKMVGHLKRAICACKVDEFNESIENLRIQSKELAEWVLGMEPEFWSDAFFKGLRYGHYSSGAAEIFNDWVSTRYEPSVLQIVDILRCKLMEMMYSRRESSNTWTEVLVPSANQKVQEEMIKARSLSVACSSDSVFEVSDESTNVINIESRECTCRRWQVTGLPCIHALAVLERMNGCIYDYCSKYLMTECYQQAYSLSINPIPDVGGPVCADSFHAATTCPPRTRRLAGRPKEKPAEPRIIIKRAVRCSRCQGLGHNKQTCKAQI
ncbi:uncharacterized protein LOC103978611 isoform X1 [Musa acuminata AAA Group]|uniref:uncharacterized protein LOC103978611 isoform X1 n=2 Tax=Musa acuminata AAA Group TaxID=214697 RepID=UPI0031DFD941